MKKRVVAGIDPGATGAIVVVGVDSAGDRPIDRLTRDHVFTIPMKVLKATGRNESLIVGGLVYSAVADALVALNRDFIVEAVAVEVQSVRPTDGKVSGAKIVGDYQAIVAIVVALGMELIAVRPKTWQAAIVFEKFVTKAAAAKYANRFKWSNHTKPESVAVAERFCKGVDLLPGRARKPSDGIADAACIALYAAKKVNSK